MMDAGPYVDGGVNLTASAEAALQRVVECCGGYEIDRDVAELCSRAANFTTDVEKVLEAASALRRPAPLDA